MQTRRGQAAVYDGGGHRGGGDGFAIAAGVLRADMAMDEETRRFHVELLADVLANLDQSPATVATATGLWLVTMFNTGQFRGERITAAAFVPTWRVRSFLLLFQLGDKCGTIFVAGIGKQITLLARQGFALAAEADAPMVSQFQGELLNLQFAPLEFGIALDELGVAFDELGVTLGELRLPCRYLRREPVRMHRMQGALGRFGAGIHDLHYTILAALNHCK